MSPIGNRKILKAGFSVDEMSALDSAEEKRKYFILRYFVPVAFTLWQENMAGNHNNKWMALHIMRNDAYPNVMYYPVITAAQEIDRKLTLPDSEWWYSHETYTQAPYTSCVPGVDYNSLSAQLKEVFGNSFRDEPIDDRPKRRRSPLVATLSLDDSATGVPNLKLNVLTKMRSSTVREEHLYNQGHERSSPEILAASEKYQRAYNLLTGEWQALCGEGEGCEECDALRNSAASNNAFDDPELY